MILVRISDAFGPEQDILNLSFVANGRTIRKRLPRPADQAHQIVDRHRQPCQFRSRRPLGFDPRRDESMRGSKMMELAILTAEGEAMRTLTVVHHL